MTSRRALAILLIVVTAIGLGLWWYFRVAAPLAPGAVGFADLPGWEQSDAGAALAAFRRSCAKLQHTMFDRTCAAATAAQDARGFFESNFTPYEIGDGLVTGYYEPLLKGSRTRHGAYQAAVYGVPDDLVMVDLGRFKPELKGERIAGRVEGHRLTPYETRAQIDARPPKTARVLFYGDDPVSVFFLHIQGSGRVQLDDGQVLRVTYAGQNGHPYTAIGRTLIARGALTRETVSMQSIRAWLTGHPGDARGVMESDASFVFFAEAPVADPALGPEGTQGVALTPRGSVAVDLTQHALGTPLFVAGQGLFIAQDTGGAIRGAPRADIFFGFGRQAEDAAGTLKAHTRFYVLLPKGAQP